MVLGLAKIIDTIESKLKMIPDPKKILENAEKWGFGPRSLELLKRALEVESLGAMPFSMYDAPPIVEEAAEDAIIIDADGRRYIDMMAGFAVSNVGHHRKEVLAAIIEQFNKLVQYSEMLSEVRVKLGEKLVEITPGKFKKKVFYGLTGSDANEVAIKIARYYTGRPIIITQWGDYHGRTIGTVPFTTSFSTWSQNYPIMGADIGVVRIPFPYCYRCPCNPKADTCEECAEDCLHLVDYMFNHTYYGLRDPFSKSTNVAGFLIEPYQSAAGYMVAPDNWLPGLYKIAREYDVLFMVDEIQTGWARTGRMWAVDHYPGVEPDVVMVAKSIANGLPFSAVIGRAEVMDSWGPGAHSSTFAGYMLGCAAALKTIEIIERENLAYLAQVKGEKFMKGLQDLMQEHPILGYVEGKGLYIGVEFVKDRDSKKPATEETKWMTMRLLQKGMLVKRAGYLGNRFALSPPLVISDETIDKAIEIFDEVFTEAEEKFNIK
jgi:4-aminobutyrate aminotransferase-like enzyme